MVLWMLLMQLHLLQITKLSCTRRTDVDNLLYFHFSLPLFSKKLGLSSPRLLLAHLLWNWLVFTHLYLSLLLQLLHCYWRTSFLLLDLSLTLSMVVVFLLLWSILTTFLTLSGLIRKWFEVIFIWFVTGIHYCYFLPIYFKIWIVCFLECNCCLIRRKELDKGKILKCPGQLIFDLPNILYWSKLFK